VVLDLCRYEAIDWDGDDDADGNWHTVDVPSISVPRRKVWLRRS